MFTSGLGVLGLGRGRMFIGFIVFFYRLQRKVWGCFVLMAYALGLGLDSRSWIPMSG